MTPFNIDFQQRQLSVLKLDLQPDEDGYERYHLSAAGVDTVINLDAGYWARPVLLTPQDAEDYYERIHYPEQRPFFSENNTFSNAELRSIANLIAHANQ